MKLILFALLIMAATVGLTIWAMQDPGYVLIARPPWSVETSLVAFAALLVLCIVLLYVLVRVAIYLWKTPGIVLAWHKQRLIEKSRASFLGGVIDLVEGAWLKAEKNLLSYMRHAQLPLLNYLAASYAAQQRGDLDSRDKYLAHAHEADPRQTLAIGLTQARLQLQTKQSEQALATLTRLQQTHGRNRDVLRLLAEVHQQLCDWKSLAELIPRLRKRQTHSGEELAALEELAYRELLSIPLAASALDTLQASWQVLPLAQRRNPRLIAVYAKRLMEFEQMDTCETLLRSALKRQWDDGLVGLYGLVQGTEKREQFKLVQEWLVQRPTDATLLLAAGRLAAANELWGQARSFLETCVAERPSAEAYGELGYLLERLGENDQALVNYRRGLELGAQFSGNDDRKGKVVSLPERPQARAVGH